MTRLHDYLFIIFSLLLHPLFAQQKDHEVQVKGVLLEEFTGISCVYCPQGHKIAKALSQAHPTQFSYICFHNGSFSAPSAGQPDLRTDQGDEILSLSSCTGFPSAMVDRSYSDQGSLCQGTNQWPIAVRELITRPAVVNISAEVSIDCDNRMLAVDVDLAYNLPGVTFPHLLNIAVIQNGILGPQTGGDMGDKYIHNHVFRTFITPTWGDTIPEVAVGSEFSKTYTYQLPGDIRSIPMYLHDLEVVVYITQADSLQVLNSRSFQPQLINNPKQLAARVLNVLSETASCDDSVQVEVKNYGVQAISSILMVAKLDGKEIRQTVELNEEIASLATAVVKIPLQIPQKIQTDYIFLIEKVNGQENEDFSKSSKTGNFTQATRTSVKNISVEVNCEDNYAADCRWSFKNLKGEILAESDPFSAEAATVYTKEVTFSEDGCYYFEFIDDFGDGLLGSSYIRIKAGDKVLYEPNFLKFHKLGFYINIDSSFLTSIESSHFQNNQSLVEVFPNPTSGKLDFVSKDGIKEIHWMDLCGKIFAVEPRNGENQFTTSVEHFPSGIYLVKIITQTDQIQIKKIIKK